MSAEAADPRYSHPAPPYGDGRVHNGKTRLTEDDKAAIRGHYAAGVKPIVIAELWGIHRSRVYQLLRGVPA